MVNQDPLSGSVTGDSGHGTMAATGGNNIKELIGVVGGVNESVTTEHLMDVEWRNDYSLFMFDDENVTKPQTPAATLMPVQTREEEDKVVFSLKSPLGKKPCF